jgi:hypothetical protein
MTSKFISHLPVEKVKLDRLHLQGAKENHTQVTIQAPCQQVLIEPLHG